MLDRFLVYLGLAVAFAVALVLLYHGLRIAGRALGMGWQQGKQLASPRKCPHCGGDISG